MVEDFSKDYWTVRSDFIRIHHVTPRTSLFDPSKCSDLPIPLEYIDIFRETRTDIEQERYGRVLTNEITDIWNRAPGAEMPADLPEPWTGSTTLYLLGGDPGAGYTRILGRVTKNRSSDKPPISGRRHGPR